MASAGTMLPAPPRPTEYTGAWCSWSSRSRSSSSSKLKMVRSLVGRTLPAPPRPPKKRCGCGCDVDSVVGGAGSGVATSRW